MPIPKPFVFLAFAATCVLEAANPPKAFVMKTTEPVIVSNTLLAPGNHLWRLLDSQSNRHIVQISDQTTQRVEAVILAIPRYRELISAENEVDFWETPVGYAKAVRTWFLPGDNSGQEFPYSKKVVLSLGRLLTPPMADPNQVEPAAPPPPRSFPVKPQEAEDKVSTQWPEGSWAVITDGPPAPPASPNGHASRWHLGQAQAPAVNSHHRASHRIDWSRSATGILPQRQTQESTNARVPIKKGCGTETDATSVGLVIAQEPPTRTSRHIDLSNQLFLAPVGASNHEVIECYTLDKNVLIISLTPHIHLRVNTMQIIADLPDG